MTKIRISVVQGPFLPIPAVKGGAVEKIWIDLNREFAHRGHDVVHYARAFSGMDGSECRDGIRYRRVGGADRPGSMKKAMLLDLQYALAIRRIVQPSDVLVTHTFFMPLVAPKRAGKVCVHVARMPKGQMGLYARTARIQAVSQALAEQIILQSPQVAHKVKIFPYSLPARWSDDAPKPDAPRDKSILFVGRVHPEKGVDILIDAWATVASQMPGWTLDIVGPWDEAAGGGGEPYRDSLVRRARSANVGDSVRFDGPTYASSELRVRYDRASVLAYPSIADAGETFGMVPLEGMARGCVPVVSALDCFREYVNPDQNALVFDHHSATPSQALAKCLIQAAQGDLERMRTAGLATGESFRPEVAADRYIKDFTEIITT